MKKRRIILFIFSLVSVCIIIAVAVIYEILRLKCLI